VPIANRLKQFFFFLEKAREENGVFTRVLVFGEDSRHKLEHRLFQQFQLANKKISEDVRGNILTQFSKH